MSQKAMLTTDFEDAFELIEKSAEATLNQIEANGYLSIRLNLGIDSSPYAEIFSADLRRWLGLYGSAGDCE